LESIAVDKICTIIVEMDLFPKAFVAADKRRVGSKRLFQTPIDWYCWSACGTNQVARIQEYLAHKKTPTPLGPP